MIDGMDGDRGAVVSGGRGYFLKVHIRLSNLTFWRKTANVEFDHAHNHRCLTDVNVNYVFFVFFIIHILYKHIFIFMIYCEIIFGFFLF